MLYVYTRNKIAAVLLLTAFLSRQYTVEAEATLSGSVLPLCCGQAPQVAEGFPGIVATIVQAGGGSTYIHGAFYEVGTAVACGLVLDAVADEVGNRDLTCRWQ